MEKTFGKFTMRNIPLSLIEKMREAKEQMNISYSEQVRAGLRLYFKELEDAKNTEERLKQFLEFQNYYS